MGYLAFILTYGVALSVLNVAVDLAPTNADAVVALLSTLRSVGERRSVRVHLLRIVGRHRAGSFAADDCCCVAASKHASRILV